MKFHLCCDLAKANKISVQELLRNASSKIYGRIAQLLLLNPHVIKIINSYITLEFFQDEIVHRSWYYLIVNDLLTNEILQERVLSLTFGSGDSRKIFDLKQLKGKLYDLIAKIATNKQTQQQKKQLLTAVKTAFGFESDQEFS